MNVFLYLYYLLLYVFLNILILNKKSVSIFGGKPKSTDTIKFLKCNYPNSYIDSCKINLIFLNIRYNFNDYISRMQQIRKSLYNDVLGGKSLHGHQYQSEGNIINNKHANRKFETFFYQNADKVMN